MSVLLQFGDEGAGLIIMDGPCEQSQRQASFFVCGVEIYVAFRQVGGDALMTSCWWLKVELMAIQS